LGDEFRAARRSCRRNDLEDQGAKDPHVPAQSLLIQARSANPRGRWLLRFLQVDDDRLGVVIGDVCGKGIPASLFMAVVTVLPHGSS
jgi:serine phosphatase RsbU (regulator of sigma subunit)